MGWQEAYLAFKNMCIYTKEAEEGFTNARFLKEILEIKWRGSLSLLTTGKVQFCVYIS